MLPRPPVRKSLLGLAAALCAIAAEGPTFGQEKTAASTTKEVDRQIQELRATQKQLLEAVRKEIASLSNLPETAEPAIVQAQQERKAQLLKLLADIERIEQEEKARPRTRYVSPTTKDANVQIQRYYDYVRIRIEQDGNKDLPMEDGRILPGRVIALVTISAKGKVVKVEVQSSSSPKLAEHCVAVLERIGNFSSFPKELLRTTDQLVFIAPFNYVRGEQ